MSEPATETASPRFAGIETWPSHAILDALIENQLAAIAAVRPAIPAIAAAVEAALPRLRAGGRLAYAGAGTSARIAVQDGAELPPTFNWPRDRLVFLVAGGPGALLAAAEGAEDATTPEIALTPNDILLAVAASGATPFTLACLHAARAAGALTIGIANSPAAPLLAAADHAILLPTGPEPLAGSTRMGAGTAQKAALNLFSTLAMMRLGRVYRGQMVDMLATNAKLRRRAVRMLQGLTGATEANATDALSRADGDVKLAVLLLDGMGLAAAEAALVAGEGDLHAARPRVQGRRDDLHVLPGRLPPNG